MKQNVKLFSERLYLKVNIRSMFCSIAKQFFLNIILLWSFLILISWKQVNNLKLFFSTTIDSLYLSINPLMPDIVHFPLY